MRATFDRRAAVAEDPLSRHSDTVSVTDPDRSILQNPAWLAHRYDPAHDAMHFVFADRGERARATFLNDEYLEPLGEAAILDRRTALAAAPKPAPVNFIFHSAFCCSTLLARAFDVPGLATPLKEPPILNDLVGWRYQGTAAGARVAEVLDNSLTFLARPFAEGEAVIIKPSNIANGLADAMLAMRPGAAAVLLYAPLPTYLRSIAKKGIDGRLWVRDLMAKQLREGMIHLGLEGDDYLRLTDLQTAAVGWLAQQALFERLAAKYPRRTKMLDSETLLTRPRDALAALAALFGLDADWVADAVAGPAFTKHSKHGADFDSAARTAEYDAAAEAHADELMKVEVWADRVAHDAGLSLVPAASLHLA